MNKKLLLILASGFLLCSAGTSQMHWLNEFDLGKSIAGSSGRLIIVDFWASWCGPCKIMDQELWQSPEMQKISGNMIGVRIDVDFDKTLILRYKVNSIPRVIIMTLTGDIIWDQAGYDEADNFLQIFKQLPADVDNLNKNLKLIAVNKNDLQANISAGFEFQRHGKNIENDELKNSFLKNSKIYFSKALKLCNDSLLIPEIRLNSIMNDVYGGRFEKAIRDVLKIDSGVVDENLNEFKHFILAKCYKGINDKENYLKEIQMIVSKELLDQMEQ